MQWSENETFTLLISAVALIISFAALIYTVRTFWLKRGQKIRGLYTESSHIACEDKYISNLTLENLKDRSVIIFSVFLKLGHNYYLEIENFENEPLILKPFEVYKKEYDPIDFYSVNTRRIEMNSLFDDKRAKRTIILSTSDGKYKVRSYVKQWNPTYDFFQNHMTATVRPMRSSYKGKAYGENVKYIIDLKMKNGREQVIPIYPREYQYKWAQELGITQDSLKSRDALEAVLYDQVGKGLIGCEDIQVNDIESWRREHYKYEQKNGIKAEYCSWFKYRFIGRFLTIKSNYELKLHNKKLQKQARPKIKSTA